jgi:hypothetical protein
MQSLSAFKNTEIALQVEMTQPQKSQHVTGLTRDVIDHEAGNSPGALPFHSDINHTQSHLSHVH